MKFYQIVFLLFFINFNTCAVKNAPKFLSLIPLTAPKPAANIILTKPTILTTTEAGSTLQFQFYLSREPSNSVILENFTVSDTNEGTLDKTSITFTKTNWNIVQFLTVTGKDDIIVDGDKKYTLSFPKISGEDTDFTKLVIAPIEITNTDNDVPGFSVSNTSGLVTLETGTTANFTVQLTSEPTSNVTIPTISSSNILEGTVSPSTLTFTPANWNVPQTVTVTGVDDAFDDGNQPYTISFLSSTSTDPIYNNKIASSVTVMNGDNEAVSGITVGLVSGNTCECGGPVTFNIVINSMPTSSATISLTSSNLNEGTVSPSTLTFTNANWNVPQVVTVTGVDDFIQDGNIVYTININPSSSANTNYASLAIQTVSVTNIDNDAAGYTSTMPTGFLIVSDGGQISSQLNINLNSQPTANVTIPISSSNILEMTTSVSSLTFTPANWNVVQSITVNGVADGAVDGLQTYSVVLGFPTSTDLIYAALDPPDQAGNSCDNDATGSKVSVCRLNTNSNTTEGGGAVSLHLILNQLPTANVTINTTSSNTAEGTLSTANITLDTTNWNQLVASNQINVTGVQDALYDGDIAYQVNFGAATSGDAFFNGYTPTAFPLVNIDDEVYFIVSAISGSTSETGTTATFTIRLATAPSGANTVTIPISSSNTSEGTVSPASILFNSANFSINQTITVTGVNDNIADGNIAFTIYTGLAVSGDIRFNGKDPNDVNVTNNDAGEKRTFVTFNTYNGNLAGIAGADAKCNADPFRPGITPNVYKALIVQGAVRRATTTGNMSVSPVDWVLATNTRYFRSDGTTLNFLSNANRIFVFGTLTNDFGTGDAWTGLNTDWTNHANNCTNWTSSSNLVNGRLGAMNVNTSSSISSASVTCDQLRSILCIQQ